MISTIKAYWGRLSLSLLILLVLFTGCLVILFVVADDVFLDKDLNFDNRIAAQVHDTVSAGKTRFMQLITFFGGQKFLLPANLLLIFFYLVIRKKRRSAIHITAVAALSTVILFSLKSILQRQRPMTPLIAKAHGFSFPSGHSLSSGVFFWMLAYLIFRNVRQPVVKWLSVTVLSIMPFLIGYSRVYLNVHYASDVIAGLCLALMWLVLAKWILITKKNDPTKKMMTPAAELQDRLEPSAV